MKKILVVGTLAGMLLLGNAGALRSASKPKAVRQRCLIGLTLGEGIFVAGAYDPKNGWQEDEKTRQWFAPGSRFSIYNHRSRLADLTIKSVGPADGVGGYYAETTGKVPPAKIDRAYHSMVGESLIGLCGVSRPMPRLPREQSLQSPLYRSAIAPLLREKGLKVPQARLTHHWRVDLNGDGIDEVLLTAHSRDAMGKEPWVNRGDYAVAALRFVAGGKVRTVPLAVDAYARENRQGALAAARFELLGCYDIDGDGRMEIALGTGYYEGFGLSIYKFDGKSVRSVLDAGWGA